MANYLKVSGEDANKTPVTEYLVMTSLTGGAYTLKLTSNAQGLTWQKGTPVVGDWVFEASRPGYAQPVTIEHMNDQGFMPTNKTQYNIE